MVWAGRVVIFSPDERKDARSKNRDVFGKSGVYLYVNENKVEKTASIYAGQARHLDSRADDPKRILNRHSIILITRKGNQQMDENWRQHLEHLLIQNLTDRAPQYGFICENRSREPASYASTGVRSTIQSWYNELENELSSKGVVGFDKRKFTPPNTETYYCQSESSARTKVYNAICEYSEDAGTVYVKEGSFAAIGRWQVAVTHQKVKTNLIDKRILVEAELNGKPCYRFTQDVTFFSQSEATAVIVNSPISWNKKWSPSK
jgi:hypothetical protein